MKAATTTKEFQMGRTIEQQAQQIAELQRRLNILEEHLMPKSNGQAIQYFTIEDFEGFVTEQLSLSALVIIEKTQYLHIKTMRDNILEAAFRQEERKKDPTIRSRFFTEGDDLVVDPSKMPREIDPEKVAVFNDIVDGIKSLRPKRMKKQQPKEMTMAETLRAEKDAFQGMVRKQYLDFFWAVWKENPYRADLHSPENIPIQCKKDLKYLQEKFADQIHLFLFDGETVVKTSRNSCVSLPTAVDVCRTLNTLHYNHRRHFIKSNNKGSKADSNDSYTSDEAEDSIDSSKKSKKFRKPCSESSVQAGNTFIQKGNYRINNYCDSSNKKQKSDEFEILSPLTSGSDTTSSHASSTSQLSSSSSSQSLLSSSDTPAPKQTLQLHLVDVNET